MTDAAEAMRERLQMHLRAAMKARDKLAVDVVRALISAIDNAGAVALDAPGTPVYARSKGRSQYVVTGAGQTEVARKTLSADDIAAIFACEAAERRTAADDFERHGKHAEAAMLRAGADLIARYAA